MANYERIYQGDIPNGKLVAYGDAASAPLDMSVAGWTCTTQILDENRDRITTGERPITILADLNGVPHFVSKLTKAESVLMVNTHLIARPATYYWSTTVANADLELEETTEITLSVNKKP